MGCLLGKQDINDIHPDIFSVHNIDHEVCLNCLYFTLKGVSSKPSGKMIVVPNFCFFELEMSNFGYLLIFFIFFNCAKLDNIYIRV